MAQEQLRSQWLAGKAGCMNAWQQALALGLREASKEVQAYLEHGPCGTPPPFKILEFSGWVPAWFQSS